MFLHFDLHERASKTARAAPWGDPSLLRKRRASGVRAALSRRRGQQVSRLAEPARQRDPRDAGEDEAHADERPDEPHKEQTRQLRADLESWEREKVGHTKEAIASWRQRRELKKLQSRADRAEDYAVNAIIVAAMDADEAEEAMLDAVVARIDAVSAQASASP